MNHLTVSLGLKRRASANAAFASSILPVQGLFLCFPAEIGRKERPERLGPPRKDWSRHAPECVRAIMPT